MVQIHSHVTHGDRREQSGRNRRMDKRATPEKRIKKRYRDHTGDKGMPPTGRQRHKAKFG